MAVVIPRMGRDFRRVAVAAAHAAAEKKALDIRVLDVHKESDIADFLVIAGADSSAQMRAIQDEVEQALVRLHIHRLHREGRPGDRWIALDYGGVVIHIQLPEARQFYRLEHLWEQARPVTWETRKRHTPRFHRP
jgi:ribosome-associated protein